MTAEPQTKAEIIAKAADEDISARKATRFLREAEEAELIHRWKFGVTKPVQFATEAQSAVSSVRARTPPHTPPAVRAHARPG